MITAHIAANKVISSSPDAFSAYEKSSFGEKIEGKIEYSSVESLYLVRDNKMQVFSGKKELDYDALVKKFKKTDKKIETKFAVYRDLRKKGYVPKTALKYGAEFRVYNKGVKPGEAHARWIAFSAQENEALNWHDFAAKTRIAHSTKKLLLIGLVDEEGSVTYYEIGWLRP